MYVDGLVTWFSVWVMLARSGVESDVQVVDYFEVSTDSDF